MKPYHADWKLGLKHLHSSHEKLQRFIRAWPEEVLPFKLRQEESIYEFLTEAIVSQQLSIKASDTIYKRLRLLFSTTRVNSKEYLKLDPLKLRGAGLSENKVRSIADLSEKFLDGTIPSAQKLTRMSNEELVETLTQVRGIGTWTVENLMIFKLGRMDVIPVDDLMIKTGYQVLFGDKEFLKPKVMRAVTEQYAPYRTVLSRILWSASKK